MAKYSLLARKEEKRNLRKAAFFTLLTIVFAVAIVVWGIPALIKMAVFFGELRSSNLPVESQDNLPPQPPILEPLPTATNQAEIQVSGITEAGAAVKIYLTGGGVKEVVADNEGQFSFSGLKLTSGRNEIYAIASDQAGNQSPASQKMIIWYDNEAPSLEINEPADGTVVTEDAGKVKISGQTDPEASLLINDHLVILDKEGNFSYNLGLSVGENKILILAKDQAGNQSEKTLTVNFSP
ncbi:hypothetical protein FJZ41_00845 [Candidatus Shapirobacteria bacterium]|nr:hypothetical protein [Candidatus Shapirobacteria bacterium]